MEFSVIIPTYNRGNNLLECLDAILQQDFELEYEVIIVDDGSTIKYELPSLIIDNPKVTYIKISHSGPAVARNKAIGFAKGRYIIFIGDDIICTSNFIKNHYAFLLDNESSASAGATIWHPSTSNIDLFPILQYIGLGNFSTENKKDCGFYAFTTSNIAIPRYYLELEKFDERFPYPALEDNELGFRLYKHGLRIRYNENALAYHKHSYTLEYLKLRQKELGYSIGYFIQKHPEVRKMYVKSAVFYLFSYFLKMRFFCFLKKYHAIASCLYNKYEGMRNFKKGIYVA